MNGFSEKNNKFYLGIVHLNTHEYQIAKSEIRWHMINSLLIILKLWNKSVV